MSRWSDSDTPKGLGKRNVIAIAILCSLVIILPFLYSIATPINNNGGIDPSGSVPAGNCDPTTGQCQDIYTPTPVQGIEIH